MPNDRHRRRGRPGRWNGHRSPHAEPHGETAPVEPLAELASATPFAIFCSLWLGITPTDGFRLEGPDAVARRFGLTRDALDGLLAEHGLRAEDLRRAGFDVESARLDIRVAPSGISRVELARPMWRELRGEADTTRG
jgi:hypothetical protein